MSRRLVSSVCLLVSCATAPVCAATAPTIGRAAYYDIAKHEADLAGLPVGVADAVMAIESAYDPTRIGTVGEIGLMQVRPQTAALLGFQGTTADLAVPEINIHFGVIYLARAWRLAGGDLCRTLMKYRAGHGEEVMSPLSAAYCERAKAVLSAAGASSTFTPAAGGSPASTSARSVAVPSVLPSPPVFRRGVSEAAFRRERARYVRAVDSLLEARRERQAVILKRINVAFLARVQTRVLVASEGRTGRD